jgi:hypothetical protein
MAGRYISRKIERDPPHRPKVSKAYPKRLFGCVGGPFDGNKVWLSGNDVTRINTMTFRVGTWCGRYRCENGTNIFDGSRKVVWEDIP